MNRNRTIAAAAAIVIAVLIGLFLLWQPDRPEPTTAAVQTLPAETETAETAKTTDSSAAKPEEPAVAAAPSTARGAEPEMPATAETPVTASGGEPEKPAVSAATTTAPDAPQTAPATSGQPAVPAPTAAAPTPAAEPAPAPAPEAAPAPVAELVPPDFDVVRVEPTGEAVLAGRAMAGSEVSVLDGDESLGAVAVDGRGQWVFVIETPLAPGSHELSLEARLSDGRRVTSTDVVVVNVPRPQVAAAPRVSTQQPAAAGATATEPAQTTAEATRAAEEGATKLSPEITVAEKPLAVLMPRTGQGPSQVLQQSATPREGLAKGPLVLETIDYDDRGAVIGGRAEPGSRLIVYLDDSALGETVAGSDGRWSLVLDRPLAAGLHRMRVDVLDPQGKVVARVETPFSRAVLAEVLPDETSVVVQPGNSLWRIARRVYGEGLRYSVIFEANKDRISDADLIYPGQIFKMPVAAPGTD